MAETSERVCLYRQIPSDSEAIRFVGDPVRKAFGETKELMRRHGVDSYFELDNRKGELLGSGLGSMILLMRFSERKVRGL